MKNKLNNIWNMITVYQHQLSLVLYYWRCYAACKIRQPREPKLYFYEHFINSDNYKKVIRNAENNIDTQTIIPLLPNFQKLVRVPYFFFQKFPSKNGNYCFYGNDYDKFFKQLTPLNITYIKPYVYYEGITFQNILFSSFTLYNVCFHNCSFYNCEFEKIWFAPKRHTDNIQYPQGFSNCIFYNTTFNECDINSTFFRMGELHNVGFINCKLSDSLFQRISFRNMWLQGKTVISNTLIFSPSKFFDIKIKGISSDVMMDSRCIIGCFQYHDIINYTNIEQYKGYCSYQKRMAFENVASTYNLFDQIRQQNSIRESRNTDKQMYYQSQKANTRSLAFPKNLLGYLSEWSFGYGEKPFRALFSISFVIVVFSFLYLFTGFNYGNATISYTIKEISPSLSFIKDFFKSLFFSFFTMISVGQGTACPVGSLSHLLMSIELFLGAIYMTLFTSSLFRKYTK